MPEGKFTAEDLLKTRCPELTGSDVAAKRREIRQYFHKTFTLYEKLFEVLASDKAYQLQPDRLRHPLIFYWGHTATFFVNKLRLGKYLTRRVNERLESVCAVGVDEMSWDDLNTAHYDWPTATEVRDYRNQVRQAIDKLIQDTPLTLPITWDSMWYVILMGCEHERIHLETSSVLFRQLPIEHVKKHPLWETYQQSRADPSTVPKNSLLPVPERSVSFAKPEDHPLYGWDNEFGKPNTTTVPAFKASKFLVSNAEWLEFMKDGGYDTKEFWTEEGWRFRQFLASENRLHPVFWVPTQSENDESTQFKYRALTEEIPMPWDWPVDVNYLEAKAWCNWKSKQTGLQLRLPAEDEWVSFRDHAYPQSHLRENDQPYWSEAPGNINLEHGASSTPIDQFEFAHGFFDVIGNVWQHTETPIAPFNGFKVHPLYDDFTVPTFDNQHNLIKGGSWIATGNEATRLARYAFRRHFYQHAGFRYVESDRELEIPTEKESLIEREEQVARNCYLHYGPGALNLAPFPKRLADYCFKFFDFKHSEEQGQNAPRLEIKFGEHRLLETEGLRALDIGCGVGRTTFELARKFDQVIGADLTTRMFRIASALQKGNAVRFALRSEGDIEDYYNVDLADIGLSSVIAKVDFMQCDANNLDSIFSNFDLIVASNLITHLYEPELFLRMIHSRIRSKGFLVLTSTYDWTESRTPKQHWLGGYKRDGENVSTLEAITGLLAPHFKLVNAPETLPFVEKIQNRVYEYSEPEITVWQKIE